MDEARAAASCMRNENDGQGEPPCPSNHHRRPGAAFSAPRRWAPSPLLPRSLLRSALRTRSPARRSGPICPGSSRGTNTSFASLKQIDAGVLNVGYAEAGPGRWSRGHSSARLALRHPHLRRRRAAAGVGGLSGDRAVPARLWHDALSVERDASQRPAVGDRRRHDRVDGCAQDREGDHRRLRLGRADGQHHGGALAGALQGHGLGERLPDRQPGSRQDAVAAEGRAPMVVPVLLRHRARPRRLREIPARLREAHLADRLAEVELRRRHLRSQRGGLRQSGSRRHRHSQLPLAARPGRRRAEIRRSGEAACRNSR